MSKSTNLEREQQILETATNLFIHYGYDKTTVGDIVQDTGISKGAFYLHFKNKEDLIENLLVRELQGYALNWLDRIEADPLGGTIGGMYKNMMYALHDNPLMAAMLRQDTRILGSYLRQSNNMFNRPRKQPSSRFKFVTMMQEAGAIRQDIDANVIAYIMNMLNFGLVAMEGVMPQEEIPSTEAVIEGIAIIMDRALTPEDGNYSEAGKNVLKQLVAEIKQQHGVE